MGPETPVGEVPSGVLPLGVMEDGGHGPQTSSGRDMGVPTHWSGAGNGDNEVDWGIYRPPPEHGRAIHCDPYYNGLVFGGRA